MNNEQILNEIHSANNHSKSTKKAYKLAVERYCTFFEMDLQELIMEAENEENNNVRWKLSSLKRRLIEFRHYILENYTYNDEYKNNYYSQTTTIIRRYFNHPYFLYYKILSKQIFIDW